jgi:hypothetical protein
MTDKELLELAAKAAGLQVDGHVNDMIAQPDLSQLGGLIVRNDIGGHSAWNPLKNDGNCFHLETALALDVQWLKDGVLIDGYEYQTYEEHGGDKYKARRYAVARAAAEIGKQKE